MADEKQKHWWLQTQWVVLYAGLAVGALVALISFLAIALPPRYANRPDIGTASAANQLKAESDLRSSILSLFIPLAAGVAGVAALLTFRETRRQNVVSLEVTRRGQVTDRFSKAIDQLGERGEPDKLDIRLGGIYALEQIARDSPELHWPIVEILTAFIREHTKADVAAPSPSELSEGDQSTVGLKVAADIQAALTVLARRESDTDRGEVDLGRTNLQGVYLVRANLQGADLVRANLESAYLPEANFLRARLRGASLQGANLYRADLQEANLFKANLRKANLNNANLHGADLIEADLQGANLIEADLQEANLIEADLQKAYLHGANLFKADLQGANLGGANLEGAEGLTQEQLDSASGDEKTKLPPGRTIKHVDSE